MPEKGCCCKCKYADFDMDGCTCMIDKRSIYNAHAYTCDQYKPVKPLSNADKIRQMTDEELAEFLCLVKERLCFACAYTTVADCAGISCEEARLQWLRKEADEDAGSKTD